MQKSETTAMEDREGRRKLYNLSIYSLRIIVIVIIAN